MTEQIQPPPQSDQVLAAALDAARVLVVVIDRAGRPSYFNAAVAEVTGYSQAELSAMQFTERVAPEDRERATALLESLLHGEDAGPHTIHWLDRHGERIRVRWSFSFLRDADGEVTQVVAVGVDVTAQHAAEVAREAAEERFRLSFDSAPVGMAISVDAGDDEILILSVNQELCRMLGHREADITGRTVAWITHPDDIEPETRWIAEWLRTAPDEVFQYEKRYRRADGETLWASVHLSLIHGEWRQPYYLAHVVDIDERRRAERARVAATVDPVTGLLNEPAFLRDLRVRLAEDLPLSVLRWQLLPASDVRAAHGHAAADRFVARGADRLAATLPPDARLARTAPDEFAAFFKATGRESLRIARDAMTRISREPETEPMGTTATMAFAAGVAACDPGQHEQAEALYAYAGVALEDAVRGGISAALSGRAERERAGKRLAWQRRLRRALADESAFLVHGQPVCDLATGERRFTELSLRMLDDEGKLVYPAVFLPVAESTGLIVDIDRWLLRRALDLLRERPGERFAVRLSAATLTDRPASDRAAELLGDDPALAERMIVEIIGAEAPVQLRAAASRLRERGCELVLLNFGMALGSLYHAKTLPVSAIKIHGSFVRDVEESEKDRAVIRAITQAARAYDRVTIAEFVESAELAEVLRELGVDHGQGFWFGRPGPVA
ncbi:MAG TPA: EAL domain-containing protein [Solirubrobacteraceae bacterium]|nr:EAL domain-containing protein [Solirubrobacteraceae bacterium]